MKKNIITLALTGVVAVGSVLGMGITSNAAELDTTTTATVFDAAYYAETYPDVVAVIGNDANALLAHYITFGADEGRNASATFNLDAYASANPDLVEVFGDNVNAYIQHYAMNGINENRVSTIDGAIKKGITVTSLSNPDVVIAQPSTTYVGGSANTSAVDAAAASDAAIIAMCQAQAAEVAAAQAEFDAFESTYNVTLDNWTGGGFFIM